MTWWVTVSLVLVALWALDRLALWAEARGWVYYRKKKPSGGGGAILGVAVEVFQPTQHAAVQVIEEQSRRIDVAEDADPLDRRDSRRPSADEAPTGPRP